MENDFFVEDEETLKAYYKKHNWGEKEIAAHQRQINERRNKSKTMWIYNKESNTIEKDLLDEIGMITSYPVSGTPDWEDKQEVVENWHFVFDINSNNVIPIAPEPVVKQESEDLPLSELGDFVDWIRDINFKKYAEGWCKAGGSNGWHCSTTELMLMYEQHKSSKPIGP